MSPRDRRTALRLLFLAITIICSEAKKKKICRDPQPMEASFYMIKEFRNGNMEIRKDKQTRMYGERSCRKALERAKNGNTRYQLCPWFYLLNFDPNREPPIVAEAHCACTNCGGNKTDACQPIYYYRHVLEFKKTRKCYKRVVRQFQNGCICRKAVKDGSVKVVSDE